MARAYLEAAAVLANHSLVKYWPEESVHDIEPLLPFFFLIRQSLELGMKGLLARKLTDPSNRQQKDRQSHDLRRLWRLCEPRLGTYDDEAPLFDRARVRSAGRWVEFFNSVGGSAADHIRYPVNRDWKQEVTHGGPPPFVTIDLNYLASACDAILSLFEDDAERALIQEAEDHIAEPGLPFVLAEEEGLQ